MLWWYFINFPKIKIIEKMFMIWIDKFVWCAIDNFFYIFSPFITDVNVMFI